MSAHSAHSSVNGAAMRYLRIEQHGRVATDTKVFFVDGDTETDISACLTGVEVHMEVGEAVTATITGYVGAVAVSKVDAEQILVDLERVQRSRLPWWRRLRDTTTFGAGFRQWVRL